MVLLLIVRLLFVVFGFFVLNSILHSGCERTGISWAKLKTLQCKVTRNDNNAGTMASVNDGMKRKYKIIISHITAWNHQNLLASARNWHEKRKRKTRKKKMCCNLLQRLIAVLPNPIKCSLCLKSKTTTFWTFCSKQNIRFFLLHMPASATSLLSSGKQ